VGEASPQGQHQAKAHLARISLQQLHTRVSVVLGLDAVANARHTLALLLQALHKRHRVQLLLHSTLEAPVGGEHSLMLSSGFWLDGRTATGS
jgi:hypothetical protein